MKASRSSGWLTQRDVLHEALPEPGHRRYAHGVDGLGKGDILGQDQQHDEQHVPAPLKIQPAMHR